MPRPATVSACLLAALFAWGPARPAWALETDQFTVPDRPLADVGTDISRFVMATLWDVMQSANTKAAWHEREARAATWPFWKKYHRGKARQFRSADYLCQKLYEALAGGGLPECKIEQWVRKDERHLRARARGPVLFRMTCGRGVYGDSPFTKPLLLVDLSPTLNVHGSYVGLDKFGHLFQQGHDYYNEYRAEENRGGDEEQALARAVRVGIGQERGIFGEGLVGVYSNADLSANYAGLKFYLHLTRPVRVGGRTLPPVLVRGDDGSWVLNPDRPPAAEGLLRPFISDHFNEALNPSRYSPQMRDTVRSRLRRRADRLVAFYETSAERARAEQAELATWHGEWYGHSGFDHVITIADNCFRRDESDAQDREPRAASARLGPSR